MTYINVTEFVTTEDMELHSGSVAELGPSAARLTWQNCMDAADNEDYQYLKTDELRQDARDHFAEFGAWSRDEIDSWTDQELTALFLQDVASTVREYQDAESSAAGDSFETSGRIYQDDCGWTFYLGI